MARLVQTPAWGDLGRLFREHRPALVAGLAAKQHRALVAGLCRAAAGFPGAAFRDGGAGRAYLAQVLGPLLAEARGLRAFAAQSLAEPAATAATSMATGGRGGGATVEDPAAFARLACALHGLAGANLGMVARAQVRPSSSSSSSSLSSLSLL